VPRRVPAVVTTNCPHQGTLKPWQPGAGTAKTASHSNTAAAPAATDPRRHRNCPGLWRGEITTGYTGDGKRTRRKVSGATKAAVIDKLRDLHTELDKGITPKAGYVRYTVRQAAPARTIHRSPGERKPAA
jgi:hypothetical protein